MTTVDAARGGSASVPATVLTPPSAAARFLGLGSVFGKALRDSRRVALSLGLLYSLIVIFTIGEIVAQFNTAALRQLMATQLQALPAVFQGMLGEPIGLERLGGFISWRIMNFLPVVYGIWAIIALSGTLAGELARGSLDLVAATPLARRRLALQKVGAFLVAVLVTITIIGISTYAAATAFATLPGDEVAAGDVAAHMLWLFLMILAPGAAAFAAAPFLGRGGALGVGALALFGSFIVSSYADMVSLLDAVRPVSYFALTEGHRPLAGVWDWPALATLAAIVVGLLAVGVEAFARRDLLVPSGGRLPSPSLRVWVMGPFSRGLGERLPAAVAWGAILGLFAIILGSAGDEFVAAVAQVPQIVAMIQQIFPDEDILSAGGFLQLAFFSEAIIMIGLAAATFVGGWASDESERRLEVILGAPISRSAWAFKSAVAVLAGVAIMTAILAVALAIGVSLDGADWVQPVIGVAVLGLYGMALAGIGLAVGGLIRPSLAAPVTLFLGLGFFLLDLFGTILELPEPILDVALQRHLGRPMVGTMDPVGLALCAAIAVGGVILCTLGMRRRDIGR
jgi:ABC-2 type transport system permease protein